jgi:hypothetical protein
MDVLPPSGEAEFVSWGMIGWQMIGAVVSVASLACLGWGLDRARRRGGAIPRAHVVVAAALTLVATVAYTLALTGVSAGLAGQVNAVVAIVASCASLFALGYVFVVALMGIRSRESPGVGWAAAAAGAAALVGASLLVMLVSYIDDTTGTVPLSAISIAGAAGWIALLAAFALGVPGGSAMPDPPAGTQPGSAGS